MTRIHQAGILGHKRHFVLVLSLGILLSIAINENLKRKHDLEDAARFEEMAIERLTSFNRALDSELSYLKQLTSFFQVRQSVSRSEFRQFTYPILSANHEIQALGWIPHIPASDLPNWLERAIQLEGLTGFALKQRNDAGEFVPAAARESYFPIFFVEPANRNAPALGFDMGSDPMLAQTMFKSGREDIVNLSQPVRHPGSDATAGQFDVLAFAPVFRHRSNVEGLHRGPAAIIGYTVLILRLDEFFAYAIGDAFDDIDVNVRLTDKETGDYLAGAQWRKEDISDQHFYREFTIDTGRQIDVSVNYAGRLWQLAITAPPHFNENFNLLYHNAALFYGVLISFFVALFLASQKQTTQRIRDEVALRTRELALSEAVSRSIFETAVDAIISIDDRGVVSRVNLATENLLGFDKLELVGVDIKRLIPGCASGQDRSCLENFPIGMGREVVALTKQGKEIPVQLAVSDIGISGPYRYTAILHDLTAIKAAHKKLERRSLTDGLTQLANRRHFDEHMLVEWNRAIRDRQPLSLILIDIDHFKLYNDHYGHVAGDECLKVVAKALLQSFNRPGDLVARYGGEEFVALLPNCEHISSLAEKCLRNVTELAIPHEKSTTSTQVTVSLGVNSIVPVVGQNLLDFINRTDRALYRAKETGRNRFCVYDEAHGPLRCATLPASPTAAAPEA